MDPDRFAAVELRHLLSFRAVAASGSFHEAADRLDYTQSAVSQHVAALEAALGVRLFERSRGRHTIALTEPGELLLRHADAIADRLAAARADLAAYGAGATGSLRVGVYQSVGSRLLPAVVGRFSAEWPRVAIRLTETASDLGLVDRVKSGVLDLTFSVLPLPDGPVDGIELLHDPYVLVVAAGSPLAGIGPCPPLQLIAEQPLIGFSSCRSTQAAESYLRRHGCDPQFVFRSEHNGTVQAMVGAGLGVALVPLLSVDAASPAVVVIPTDLPPRRIALMWHRDRYRSPAAERFVGLARDVGAELQATVDAVASAASPHATRASAAAATL